MNRSLDRLARVRLASRRTALRALVASAFGVLVFPVLAPSEAPSAPDSERIWVVGVNGRGLRALTRGADDSQPVVSPNGRQVAFMRNDEANGDIWIVGSDGRNLRQVTDTSDDESDPQWAPGGRLVSYSVFRGCGYRCGESWVEIRRADGRGAPNVVRDARRLRWSRTGRVVYEGDVGQVYFETGAIVVGVGRQAREVADGGASPTLSPDGRLVAYSFHDGEADETYLRVVTAAGRQRRTLSRGPTGQATWSANARFLAYGTQTRGIYRARADGSGARRRLGAGSLPVWAPRTNRIAFMTAKGIAVVRPDGTALKWITRLTSVYSPAWSPDGRLVYFSSRG